MPKNLVKKSLYLVKKKSNLKPLIFQNYNVQSKFKFRKLFLKKKPYALNKAKPSWLVNCNYSLVVTRPLKFTIAMLRSISLHVTRKQILKKKRDKILWFRVNFNWPLTKKPLGIRMGKGKGDVDSTIFYLKSGSILCEFGSSKTPYLKAQQLSKIIQQNLPTPLKIIQKVKLLTNYIKN